MLNKVAEQKIHTLRYVLVVGWLLLILSLFYEPISQYLTEPNSNLFNNHLYLQFAFFLWD